MDIISLPVDYDQEKIDGRFRLVSIASQRAKDLSVGIQPKITTKAKKISTIAIEETIDNTIEFLVGDEAKQAKEEAKKFDYRKLLEEKKRELSSEDLTDFEKDLKVYLNEKETIDKSSLEGLFSDKREEGTEE